jgi:DNA modification methylase
MKPLIQHFSKQGDIVLDPFCGSGSTLLAARESGRRYIGIEKDLRMYETLRARLSPDKARSEVGKVEESKV